MDEMGCCSGGVVWCMVVYGVWCMADYLDGFGAKEFRRGRMNEVSKIRSR